MNTLTNLDYANKIIIMLGGLIEKDKKCSINIVTNDDEIIVNVLFHNFQRKFSSKNGDSLIQEIYHFVSAFKHYHKYCFN